MKMSETVIRVESLGKQYRIGRPREAYGTLRDALASAMQDSLKLLREGGRTDGPRYIWALQDVSFDVQQGEVFGVIGRNGAGKSTLLKILSKVTYPTSGRAEVWGRVGSLLEVGTGFHPELTGRENIFLNGAVLGMKRLEIQRKFDEIVNFAEIEPFLDTPVKRYSSGMYMRLAFAVSAHLDPEILIVDEVLAVGDIQFQKKCLGKMQDVAKSDGRTVLFVSHNMDAIRRLCSRCLLLEGGKPILIDETERVIAHYLMHNSHPSIAQPDRWIDLSSAERSGTGDVRFKAARFSSHDRKLSGQPYSTGGLEFLLELESNSARSLRSVAVNINDSYGNRLVNADLILLDHILSLKKGPNLIRLQIEHLYLNPGVYRVGLWLADPLHSLVDSASYDSIEHAFDLQVVNPGSRGNGLNENAFVSCDFYFTELQ